MFDSLPRTLRIGPHDYRLEVCAMEDWGDCCNRSLAIRINVAAPSPHHAVDTVLHEIKHAIWSAFCLERKDGEERIVRVLATGLMMVFRDNPPLVAWIQSSLK